MLIDMILIFPFSGRIKPNKKWNRREIRVCLKPSPEIWRAGFVRDSLRSLVGFFQHLISLRGSTEIKVRSSNFFFFYSLLHDIYILNNHWKVPYLFWFLFLTEEDSPDSLRFIDPDHGQWLVRNFSPFSENIFPSLLIFILFRFRYLAVVHPIASMSVRTEAHAFFAICIAWAVILTASIPVLIMHGEVSHLWKFIPPSFRTNRHTFLFLIINNKRFLRVGRWQEFASSLLPPNNTVRLKTRSFSAFKLEYGLCYFHSFRVRAN